MDDARSRVRERIVRQLHRVNRRMTSLRNGERSQEAEAGGDNTPLSELADAAQVTEEREMEMQILDWLVDRSDKLRDALRRIDESTYGMCEVCNGFIHPQRLAAFPESFLCLDCQTDFEMEHPVHPATQRAYPRMPAA